MEQYIYNHFLMTGIYRAQPHELERLFDEIKPSRIEYEKSRLFKVVKNYKLFKICYPQFTIYGSRSDMINNIARGDGLEFREAIDGLQQELGTYRSTKLINFAKQWQTRCIII